MNVQIAWFGLAWVVATLLGFVGPACLVAVALGPARRRSSVAMQLLVVAALMILFAMGGEVAFRGSLGALHHSVTVGGRGLDLRVTDVWTVVRPILEGVALALVAAAVWHLGAARSRGAASAG